MILSALQTTVDLYLSGPATDSIPALAMLGTPTAALQGRAKKIVIALEALPMKTAIGQGESQVGGGTLPRAVVPSITLDLQPLNMPLNDFVARLRAGTPPVIGYVASGRFKLDLRTIFPRQDEELFRAIHTAFADR